MKTFITALLAVVILSSCSVYRSGQTPDDVYYSPARQDKSAAYVETNDVRDEGRRYEDTRTYNGYNDYATSEDRWLMMRVRNPYRWSYFDDYNYYSPYSSYYSPYGYYDPYGGFGYSGWGGYGGFGYGFQPGITLGLGFGYYSPYYWNNYYNPYYPKVVVVNPKTDPAAYHRLRNFSLNSYSNRNYNYTNSGKVTGPRSGNRATLQGYNNSNNNTLKNSFRRVFAPSSDSRSREVYRSNDNYKMPSQDRPVRVYTPSNNSNNSTYSPSSSGGSSSGSSGSRPSRR